MQLHPRCSQQYRFSRLTESTAERKHGATLHEGSALKPTVCELTMTFESGCQIRLRVRQRLSIVAERRYREFFSLVCPTFTLSVHIRRRILETLSKLFTKKLFWEMRYSLKGTKTAESLDWLTRHKSTASIFRVEETFIWVP